MRSAPKQLTGHAGSSRTAPSAMGSNLGQCASRICLWRTRCQGPLSLYIQNLKLKVNPARYTYTTIHIVSPPFPRPPPALAPARSSDLSVRDLTLLTLLTLDITIDRLAVHSEAQPASAYTNCTDQLIATSLISSRLSTDHTSATQHYVADEYTISAPVAAAHPRVRRPPNLARIYGVLSYLPTTGQAAPAYPPTPPPHM